MNLVKFGSRASAALVAVVAGYSSYRHIFEVATKAGEDFSVAAVLPLSIDGLVVVASLAMLEDKRNGRIPRWSARVALVFGILMTLGFNLASAEPTWKARAVATVSAVSFLLAVEVLSRTGKGARSVSTPVQVAIPTPAADKINALEDANPEPVVVGSSELLPTPVAPVKVKPRKPRADKTADRVRQAAAEMPSATSLAKIAAKAGVSESTARRHLTDHQPQALLVVGNPAIPDAEMTPATTSNGHKASTTGVRAEGPRP